MHQTEPIAQNLNRVQLGALIIAAVGILFSVIGASADIDHFFQIYLVAFLFWVEVAVGCLGFLLLTTIVSGRWGFAITRLAAAGARTLPLLAVLFIPILLGMENLFPWTEGVSTTESVTNGKAIYLTGGFFVVRAVIYFAVWIGLAYFVSGWSYRHDQSGDEKLIAQSKRVSILGLLLFFVTTTFAAFDWSMSLDPDWFSSVYGWLMLSRAGLAAMSVLIISLWFFWKKRPLVQLVTDSVVGDLGALQLVALMVWIYLNFMQYIIYWTGNLPSKVNWYIIRSGEGWGGFLIFLALFHGVAFMLLVIPGLKRIRWVLVSVAGLLLFMRVVDLIWVVMPTYQPEFVLQWWDIAVLLAFGGVWVAMYIWSIGSHALLPEKHPDMPMAHDEGDAHEAIPQTS